MLRRRWGRRQGDKRRGGRRGGSALKSLEEGERNFGCMAGHLWDRFWLLLRWLSLEQGSQELEGLLLLREALSVAVLNF